MVARLWARFSVWASRLATVFSSLIVISGFSAISCSISVRVSMQIAVSVSA
ncbi:hypothetical protein D3C81_2123630 [compost metagenome]